MAHKSLLSILDVLRLIACSANAVSFRHMQATISIHAWLFFMSTASHGTSRLNADSSKLPKSGTQLIIANLIRGAFNVVAPTGEPS